MNDIMDISSEKDSLLLECHPQHSPELTKHLPFESISSITYRKGLVVSIQSRFELMNSSIYYPEDNMESQYFFLFQVVIKPIDSYKGFLNKDMVTMRQMHSDLYETVDGGDGCSLMNDKLTF
jgi:hypothetical protein